MLGALPPDVALNALLAALESAGIGCTIVLEQNGRLERVFANDAISRIFGRTREEMLEQAPMDLLPAAERARLGVMRRETEGGEKGAIALRTAIMRPDGTSVPVEVGLTFEPIEGRRAVFAFLRDVTEPAKMEAALRESEEHFRKLADLSPDSVTVVSGGRFVYANPAALHYLGLESFEQLQSVDPMSLTPSGQREVGEHIASRLARGEPVRNVQFRTSQPDGRQKVFESSMLLTSMRGEPAVISYSREISDRLALQAELMKHDRLASVGMLAAGVAHELNNPLMSLSLEVRRLVEGAGGLELPASVREGLAQIDEAATRMRGIIGDLLFMARPAEKPQVHVDIAKVMTSTVALLRAGAPEVKVELTVGELPPVCGFPSKLGQVFLNVLRNAAQALENRIDGRIRIEAEADDELVRVVISDNGPGIAAAHLERVAQPFFTTKPHGMGMGLWISRSVMVDHGGRLDIESVEGEGTSVTLTMPIRGVS